MRPRMVIDPDLFRRLWAQPGLSVGAIASVLDISQTTARTLAADLLLPVKRPGPIPARMTAGQVAVFARLYGAGLPVAAIADLFGISPAQVSRIAYRRGLEPRRPRVRSR